MTITVSRQASSALEKVTEKAASFIKPKAVKFADPGEDPLTGSQGANGTGTQDSKAGSSVREHGPRRTPSTWLGATASSQRGRRRRWRKISAKLNPRFWIHVLNKRMPIILPNNTKRRNWDLFVLVLVVWTAVMVPFEVGFGNIPWDGMFWMDRVVDAVFWVDICLNFRSAYVDQSADLIRDGTKIARHYLRTWFPIDLMASIPFDVIILWFVSNISQQGLIALGLLRTPRLLRLGRLLRYFDRVKGANAVRMIKLLFFMALVAHWVSCLWFMLYRLTRSQHLKWTFDLIPNAQKMTYYAEAYLQSFLLMIGNDSSPQNNIERLYCTGILVIGACFYAIIVGHMSLLVNNLNPTASRHKFKKDIINNTVKYLGAPPHIASRVDEYFDYLTHYTHPGADGMALIAQLPSSMFQDIYMWMYKDVVTKVPLFKDCEPAFITQLVIRLKMAVFLPGEVIFRIGDVGHEMYFITKGHIAVHNDHGEMLANLNKGGFFGELALLATARRTAQCVAMCHCDLTVLMAHDLVVAMRDFPESAAKVRAHAVKRLADMQTAGKVASNTTARAPRHVRRSSAHSSDAGLPRTGSAHRRSSAESMRSVESVPMSVEGAPARGLNMDGSTLSQTMARQGSALAQLQRGPSLTLDEQDLSDATIRLVDQAQSALEKMSGKIDAMETKLGKMHTRLGKVEANPNIFNTTRASLEMKRALLDFA